MKNYVANIGRSLHYMLSEDKKLYLPYAHIQVILSCL